MNMNMDIQSGIGFKQKKGAGMRFINRFLNRFQVDVYQMMCHQNGIPLLEADLLPLLPPERQNPQ